MALPLSEVLSLMVMRLHCRRKGETIAILGQGRSPISTPIKTNASLDRKQSVTSFDIFRVDSLPFSLLG
jgi:hypothetical protein